MAEKDLLERLRERTGPARQPDRSVPFNHPPLYYMRPDGDVVRLQGDAGSRMYYEEKGFAAFRPDEARAYERDYRPRIMAERREKARLINAIREIVALDPRKRVAGGALAAATVAQLEEMLAKAGGDGAFTVIGGDVAVPVPDDDEERDGAPVPLRDGAELEAELERTPAPRKRSN